MSNFVPTQFASFTDNFDLTDTSTTFISHAKSMRKVDDFFDFSRMSIPHGVLDAHQRVMFNLSYFTPNYFAVAFIFFLYLFFTNIPFFLFVILEMVIFYFVQKAYGNTEELNLKIFSLHKNVWYSILLMINIPLLFFWSPLSTVFWLAIMAGSIILAHAAILDKPVEAAYSSAV